MKYELCIVSSAVGEDLARLFVRIGNAARGEPVSRIIGNMSRRIRRLLKEFKTNLNRIYGEQLKAVYLYGSYARGENVEGSDLDFVVVLKDFQRRAAEIRRTSELVGNLSLDYEITVSPLFLRENEWETNKFALLRNVKAEGAAL